MSLESIPLLSMKYVVYAFWVWHVIDVNVHVWIWHGVDPNETEFNEQFGLFLKDFFIGIIKK